MNRLFFMRNRSMFEKVFLLFFLTCMVLVTPFSTYLSSDNYIQMNESFINISFTPAEVLFIGVVALFIFIIFGGRNDDEDSDNGDSLNAIKPLVGKFESDEDLGQYVRALANANKASTKRNTSQKKPSKSK
ncbi:MAG: hypothetical protein VXX52_04255 [Candidatus Neomarinimicrobiota bacterium]|nr:hypothetical protein [Candidatus Neomarinimicrobiota bacterium]MEC8689858.1 hypothetical protein [Candidatus Neomarinimicrobiota bacterium]